MPDIVVDNERASKRPFFFNHGPHEVLYPGFKEDNHHHFRVDNPELDIRHPDLQGIHPYRSEPKKEQYYTVAENPFYMVFYREVEEMTASKHMKFTETFVKYGYSLEEMKRKILKQNLLVYRVRWIWARKPFYFPDTMFTSVTHRPRYWHYRACDSVVDKTWFAKASRWELAQRLLRHLDYRRRFFPLVHRICDMYLTESVLELVWNHVLAQKGHMPELCTSPYLDFA